MSWVDDIFNDRMADGQNGNVLDVYTDGWHIETEWNGSISGTVKSLADVFVEWYLHTGDTINDIEQFLIATGMETMMTTDDFMALMSGAAYLDDVLCTVVVEKLPFDMTWERFHNLNDATAKKDGRACVSCRDRDAAARLMADVRAEKIRKRHTYRKEYYNQNLERMREYHRAYYRRKAHKRSHEYYQENRERILAYHKEMNEKNKEKNREKRRADYSKNKEKNQQRAREYYQANRERIKEIRKKYYAENTEKVKERSRKYYRNNTDEARQKSRARYQKGYYTEHRAEQLERVKQLKARYDEQNELTKTMCPAFIFLTQFRAANKRLYLVRYKRKENIVNTARKTCVALRENDVNQCPLMRGDLKDAAVRAECTMPRVFEFDTALTEMKKIIEKLQKSQKTK